MAVGGTSLTKLVSGTTYYWRVRSTKPIKSPWSATWSLAPTLGDVQGSALATSVGITPSAGAVNVPIMPAFTWSPVSGATGYEFMLAKDSEFTDVVVAMTGADALPTTVWACDRNLDYFTTYFWKVRPISATTYGQWVTNVFSTEAAPSSSILPHESSPSPSLLWIVIGIGVGLVVSLLVFIVRTGRKF
jgi:hypothetical protein